jgi:site-specific recombinase XerD
MTIKYLTEAETKRLFSVITSIRDRAIFRIAYHRGLRAGELRILQMDDYRSDTGRLFVHRLKCRKKNTSGEYVLVDEEKRALRAYIKERGPSPGPIFLSNRKTAISKQMLDVLMKAYCLAAKIPNDKAHMHALRHSCATHMMTKGEDMATVQDHLGHANIANTQVYAQITSKRRDAAAKRLKTWR